MTKRNARSLGLLVKRSIDIVVASIGLGILSPFLLLFALVVRLFLGSPVLYIQERPGLGGVPFKIYKFRTMRDLSNEAGDPLPDEERLTSVGRLFRALSIDELPELVNVLRGDMSIVGPRPLLMQYLPLYTKHEFRRHEMRPGISGLAQVGGRNTLGWEERFERDVWYVDHWSLWLDATILLRTSWRVLTRRGISQPGHATMKNFERPVERVAESER